MKTTATKSGLNGEILHAYLNKRSFIFKIKFYVFQETKTFFCMKVIRVFNVQPVKIP